MIGLREKEKAQAPRGPFRGVVRLHVRRLPPLALPTHSRARVPLAGGEPGTGPPPRSLALLSWWPVTGESLCTQRV